MTYPPTVTEREAVLREREAFLAGWAKGIEDVNCTDPTNVYAPSVVAGRYPLPQTPDDDGGGAP
jgi:hypothetical protein